MRKTGQSTRRDSASIIVATMIVMFGWLPPAHADPISIPVLCQGETVGSIDVDVQTVVDGGRTVAGVVGAFNVAEPPIPRIKRTLAQTAAFCNEDHFNWYQIIQYDSDHPDISPYVDPPSGGYPGQWADDLAWYWDEKVPAPKPPTFQPRFQLSENTHEFSLDYKDFPLPSVGGFLDIIAFLVSLDKDGKFVDYHGGFEYYLDRPAADKTQISQLFPYIVPEPSTISLIVLPIVFLVGMRLKRKVRVAN